MTVKNRLVPLFRLELVIGERHELFAKVFRFNYQTLRWYDDVFSDPRAVICYEQADLILTDSLPSVLKALPQFVKIAEIGIAKVVKVRGNAVVC